MVIVTGDIHGDGEAFFDMLEFCERLKTTKKDIFVVLGDVGVNYYLDHNEEATKEWLETFPITFFFVRGNHEERPENIPSYKRVHVESGRTTGCNGKQIGATPADIKGDFFMEPEYPSLLFTDNGLHELDGKKVFVINGAYSVDKWYRLKIGAPWFQDEELFDWEKEKILQDIEKIRRVDCVFSHTCPMRYMPEHALLPGIKPEDVPHGMEEFLDKVDDALDYDKWYCGHYHIDEVDGRMHFVFNDYLDIFNEG